MFILSAMMGSAVASPVNTYRYWRLYITANVGNINNGNYPAPAHSLNEIELRATLGGVDLTTSSTPVVASDTQANFSGPPFYGAERAIDDSIFTSWITNSNTTPCTYQLDLAAPTKLAQVALMSGSGTNSIEYAPRNFLIQGSNDASVWTTCMTVTNYTGYADGTFSTFDL